MKVYSSSFHEHGLMHTLHEIDYAITLSGG